MLVVKEKEYQTSKMLSFKTLTLAPIDIKLIDKKILNKEETIWINNYHSKVYREISNKVTLNVKKWLIKAHQKTSSKLYILLLHVSSRSTGKFHKS